jgi:PAS domain S-box-containing protein
MTDASKARTWLNRPWLEFTGRTMDQELNRGWEDGVHPSDIERFREVYSSSFDTRQPFEMDYRLRRHDGIYRWVLDRGIPITGSDGTFLGYMGGVIDINERKSAEENSEAMLRIEQAARVEAERAALMKDEFLATVSHEMRTPLTAMLGWVQMLRSGSLAGDAVPHALETIERNARAQAKLINDLLDMSRILSGRLRLDIQQVNLTDIVEAAISTAEPAAAAKKISVVRQFEAEAESVSADASRLQQVIWNLLNNAIKFTPSGGEVKVVMKRLESQMEITVSDSGEGIEPEFLPHVFERFRQQDSSTDRRHQGLGLGLSIVKQLVELHGGSVRALSEGVGKGAAFTVVVPLSNTYIRRAAEPLAQRKEEHPPAMEAPPSILGVKVLVVDDDNDARELLRSILAHHGASVRTAASAADAIKEFAAKPPQILLSDIGMPGEDGYELIRKIRALDSQEAKRVPAVALTAFARSEDRRRAIGAGFNMHLSKPVEPAELLTIVASLTKGSPS